MPVDHTEKGFEQAIEHCLLASGYRRGVSANFDPALAVDRPTLLQFLKDSQPTQWSQLASIYGQDVELKAIENIAGNLDQRGMLECLRHGVSDRGVKLRLAYFQPATSMNPDALALYKKNIFTISRQVHFAVDPSEVYMATRLAGKSTFFLPFNKGRNGGRGWLRRSTRTPHSWPKHSLAAAASP
jgi:type I restriction enzyme R subunit